MTAALTHHERYPGTTHVSSCRAVGRLGPTPAVFIYRRLGACLVLALIVLGALAGARTVLADRGAVPASSSAIRRLPAPQTGPVGSSAVGGYLVQPGDTLWSIAQKFHGSVDIADYVDRLVASRGGTSLQVGDIIRLP